MRKNSWVFLLTFLSAAGAVAGLVLAQRTAGALAAGIAGLVLYWALSTSPTHDGELADASYFFGFLLTLVFLAAGLVSLGGATLSGPAGVLGFLRELGAGLALTIVGLMMRQLRTLAATGRGEAASSDSLTEAQRELAQAMRVLIRALESRPQEVAAGELQDTRSRAREATEGLERNVVQAAERIETSMRQLEQSTTTVTSTLLRAGSGLSDALTTNVERIQLEIAGSLAAFETQRRQIETSIADARTAAEETQRRLAEQMAGHADALSHVSAAGTAFVELAERVKHEVQALPNPGERLIGLWDDVRSLESTLSDSIAGAAAQLTALGARSEELSKALGRLERSTANAAGTIESGGAELGESIRRELSQMNQVLDEFTRLFERDFGAASVR
jgi:chromosome segregation ATPase